MNARNKYGSAGEVSGNIRTLLEQRSDYQDWLSRLDELGAQYRPSVAARVRADYEDRLAGVSSELEQHRSSIEDSLHERKLVHEEAGVRFEEASADIEEFELRFQVGELDESTWEKRKADHVSGLESIAAQVEVAAAAVGELEAVLADLDHSGPVAKLEPKAVSEPAPEPDPVVETASVVEPAADVEPAPVVEAAKKDAGSDFLDELEFLESLSLDDADSFDAVSRMLEDEET